MYFEKYVFLKEKIEGYNVFKIIDSPKSAIFVNEIFVDSVEKQGITGFKFDLVWQDNDSNSVVHEEKKEASANPKIELKANVASLDEDFMNELYKMKWEAKALIGASEDDSPAKVVEFIYEYIERLQKMGYRQHSDEKINDISILLAAAWGLSVCEEYNWEWRELEVAGKIQKNYYILSPDHCYCCPPFYFMANILREENIGVDRKNDNTVLLLFNMLKTIGEKPTGEKYTVIT